MSENGARMTFDVTELIEGVPFKAGAYSFTIPPDMSLSDLTSIKRETQVIEKASTDDTVDVEAAETRLWAIFERLMARADPPPPRNVRGDLFTTAAMLSILGFLLIEWGAAKNSITSLQSRTSTEAQSASETSPEAPSSTAVPSA